MNSDIIRNLKILQEFEKLNKQPFKANAYDKVIDSIELSEIKIKSATDLKNIKGIGKGIEKKILQFLEKGSIDDVETILKDDKYILSKKLSGIYGIGPAKINDLMESITSFDQLYLDENKKLLNNKQKIGLKYYDDLATRIPYAEGKQHYKIIQKAISQIDKDVTFEMVGSYRRKNKDMGDIDILIKDNGSFTLKTLISNLQSNNYVIESLASGKNKFMGICKINDLPARRIDILIADPSYYYFALLYFTGSYNFNIYMRRIALKKGLSLSEYGFKDNSTKQMLDTSDVINSEEDIFKYLEIPYTQPNKR
jgi:DNA polymerase/3'-5' exonuclease PolX